MPNPVTAESEWRAIGDCTFEAWTAEITARAPSSPILRSGRAAYDAARPHSALCLGMMWIEDQFQTDPSDAFPITNYNPMNMRTPDGAGWMDFDSYPDGIQGWKNRITSPTYKPQAPMVYAKTTTVRDLVNVYAPSSENDVADYITVTCIVANSALKRGNVPDQGGPDPVAPYSTQVPGLPGGPLQTTYPIRMNLIPLGNTFQRPGIKARTPRVDVTHGTGNPSNAFAMVEAQYFVNGAEGRQASVHACIDDTQVVIVVPLDEVTWQAADGGGPGNMNGNSSEMMEANAIWDNTARRNKLIAITADFKGRTAARLGITVPKKHYDYNAGSADRHHCPDKLMTTGLWDSMYVPMWQAARADELKRMNGETPPPEPTYTAPSLPPWFNAVLKDDFPENQDLNGQRFLTCKKRLYVKKATVQRATASLKGARSGPDIAAGVALDILGIFRSGGGTKYVLAAGSTKDKIARGARIKMADLDELISITER